MGRARRAKELKPIRPLGRRKRWNVRARTITIEMLERDDGQALVEYALIIMLIATVAFATLQLIGISLDAALDEVVTDLSL